MDEVGIEYRLEMTLQIQVEHGQRTGMGLSMGQELQHHSLSSQGWRDRE